MHDSERVLESGMHCTWVDIISPSELPNSTQPLKSRLRNYTPFPIVQGYEAVNGAANFIRAVRITQRQSSAAIISE